MGFLYSYFLKMYSCQQVPSELIMVIYLQNHSAAYYMSSDEESSDEDNELRRRDPNREANRDPFHRHHHNPHHNNQRDVRDRDRDRRSSHRYESHIHTHSFRSSTFMLMRSKDTNYQHHLIITFNINQIKSFNNVYQSLICHSH